MEVCEKLDDDNADIDGVVYAKSPNKTSWMLKYIDNNMMGPINDHKKRIIHWMYLILI